NLRSTEAFYAIVIAEASVGWLTQFYSHADGGRASECDAPRGRDFSPRPSQHQSHVVRLFVVADPVIDRSGHDLTDLFQRQAPIFSDQVDQPLFTEFAEIILWFGDAIAVGYKDLSRMHLHRALVVAHVVEQ